MPTYPPTPMSATDLAAWTGVTGGGLVTYIGNEPNRLDWQTKFDAWQRATLALKNIVLNVNPQVVTVGAVGCDFTAIQAAIDSCTDAGPTKPYRIDIGPGDYNEQITTKDYVHLFGYGNEEGATVGRIHSTGWVLKAASAGTCTNIRFKIDAPAAWSSASGYVAGNMVLSSGIQYLCILAVGPTATTPAADATHWQVQTVVKIFDGQGSTINPGRWTMFDCYYEVSGDFGASDVKLSENNSSTSTIVHASCLVYWRPQTTGKALALHDVSGSQDAQGLIFGHYLPTGFSECTLWTKDDAAVPDEISGLVISREYPTGANVNLFKCNNTTGAYPALMYVNEIHGMHFIKSGNIVAGTHPEMIMGQRLSTNLDMTSGITSADFEQACTLGMAVTPQLGSAIAVFVDGIRVNVGDGVRTADCYFSGDGGTTPKGLANIIAGDLLYWVGSVAGFELDGTDVITIDYAV